MNFTATQHLDHNQFGYMITDESSGRVLGGFGANYYRPWVFPLYTPSGLTVIREFPYDHPFHNGVWVAQGPLLFEGREVHFWPAPPMRRANEALFDNMGRMDCQELPKIEARDSGVRFTLNVTWRDKSENPVLDEVRTVDFYAADGGTVCDVTSAKTAAYGAIEYAQSKFGSIGVRVEPRLLPQFGGEVLAGLSGEPVRRGTADVAVDQLCDYVAYENLLAKQECYGVMMSILGEAKAERGPWFVRDYGMAMYNVTRNRALHSAQGETWSAGLRVVAYDGPMTDERANGLMALNG